MNMESNGHLGGAGKYETGFAVCNAQDWKHQQNSLSSGR